MSGFNYSIFSSSGMYLSPEKACPPHSIFGVVKISFLKSLSKKSFLYINLVYLYGLKTGANETISPFLL